MKIVPIDLFLKLMFNIVIDYMNVAFIYSFYLKIREIEKFENLVAILHTKKEYVIHITNLKQVLNHWLVLKKSIGSLNSIKNEKKKKKFFLKEFFKLMNNSVFKKDYEKYKKKYRRQAQTTDGSYMKLFDIRTKLSYRKIFF